MRGTEEGRDGREGKEGMRAGSEKEERRAKTNA